MIIVSMTSFQARIKLVPLAYKHFIENQTLKCDKYVLWLSRSEFNGEKSPEELGLVELVEMGLEMHWCDEDSKIHVRHNSLKLWPNDYNLIIDEDLYYPPTYTEELIEAAKRYPDTVISYFSSIEIFTGYRKFYLPRIKRPSWRNKFNGGLVCFPPNTFPQYCFKYSDIRDAICPYHDETWVNLFLKFQGGKVYGLHKMVWSSIEHIEQGKHVVHLHDVHSHKGAKYSFDAVQFNQVLYVFPDLLKMYKKMIFGLYFFCDNSEKKRIRNSFSQIRLEKF